MATAHIPSPAHNIRCPSCGALIPITETLEQQLTEHVPRELEATVAQKEQAVRQREHALKEKEDALRRAAGQVDQQVQERLAHERAQLLAEATQKAQESLAVEFRDLQTQLREKHEQPQQAQETELSLRKRERELEDGKRSLELDVAKRIDEEKRKIEEETANRLIEERRLKDLEKEKQIHDMRQQIEELKRKAEQGSEQLQGEVLELELEAFLKAEFPLDDIQPAPKDMRGADVLQRIYSRAGEPCGAIIWESKRTKNWSEGRIEKLKDDQREARADIAVLVSDSLPKDIRNVALRKGVRVTNDASILGITTALRLLLTQVAVTRRAAVGKNEKVEGLFQYLTGPEFRQRVEAILETFTAMKRDLDEEKRAYASRRAKREKHIERVLTNTAGLYGDLQGLIGSSPQSIPALEAGAEEAEELPLIV